MTKNGFAYILLIALILTLLFFSGELIWWAGYGAGYGDMKTHADLRLQLLDACIAGWEQSRSLLVQCLAGP